MMYMPETWIFDQILLKNNSIFSQTYPNSLPGLPLCLINTDIVFVPFCTFLGISVTNHDISDRNIPQSVQNVYHRSNKVMSYFKSLSLDVKSSTFCLDAYGSQLWSLLLTLVKLYYTACRKVVRISWCLPFTTHCRFLHTINNALPIDVQFGKICLKFLHSCINGLNEIYLSSIQQFFLHLVRIIVIVSYI